MILASGIYQQIPLNTSEIPQCDLNIKNKVRSNPLAWNGQFSPQLIQVLLSKYGTPGTTVFDPFLGSGTVLLEAGRAGLAASGTEISPAAVILSQTYRFINVTPDLRRPHLDEIERLLHCEFPDSLPLFQNHEGMQEQLEAEAIKARLSGLVQTVEEGLQHQLLETLVALLDFYQPNLSVGRVLATWRKLAQLVIELPYSQKIIEVYHADARRAPLPSSSIDLVITSPPYINVFNYHQQYRASMEALNWNLLKVARSEIGSNRKHRANRFLTVIQYCLDLSQIFYELTRVCRPKSRLIFIVGRESTVKGVRFFNSEIAAEIAHRVLGFDLILRQERVFLNRFGQNIFEDILHCSPPTGNVGSEFLEDARGVARDVLEETYLVAPDEAKEYMKSAIEGIELVRPSPIFNPLEVVETQ